MCNFRLLLAAARRERDARLADIEAKELASARGEKPEEETEKPTESDETIQDRIQ
jgi:hypothetical protein